MMCTWTGSRVFGPLTRSNISCIKTSFTEMGDCPRRITLTEKKTHNHSAYST